ncbi:hypothetical protein [Couchioplanes azureus]|uniref:hypothetical protein n=1 Tax=Couchioplanes caeruleus TaxID=56438 RepID=UPI00166FBAAC|nr:hypothetical protein [Couchioplanes caeruleus]GGQ70335.1 hypothetical protein GCM10010166_45280 [Couchioplanes caeruleus subsp. azureus]
MPAIVTFARGWRLGKLAAAERSAAGHPSPAGGSPATHAKPTGGSPAGDAKSTGGMRPRRRRALVVGGVASVAALMFVPLPADAAPAPCEQAQRYSAQSGSQILRLTHLAAGSKRDHDHEVHVGEAKSALVAQAQVSSAAVARMIDVTGAGTPAGLSDVLYQQAPPTNAKAARRATRAGDAGPVSLGAGGLTTHARWDAGMACGATEGEVTRAAARLRKAGIAGLARVPGKVESESTTKLEGHGAAATTVAAAGLRGGDLDLLDGAVHVKIVKAPSLRASMSMKDGGEIRYVPAVVEVSGRGFRTERLDTAGDTIEVTVDDGKDESSGDKNDDDKSDGKVDGDPGTKPEESELTGLVGKLPVVGQVLNSGKPLPLPEVPGVPDVEQPDRETAPSVESGTKVRISLGEVRQAARGRAIAARATALSVAVARGSSERRTKPGYGDSVALAFDMGLLEAAAVAPESATGGVSGAAAGAGAGLPITGPRVDVIALSGVALLIAGAAALFLGTRGRSRSSSD